MHAFYKIYLWKRAPFLRLLLPGISGILLQYYLQFSISIIITGLIVTGILLLAYQFLQLGQRFRFQILGGLLTTVFVLYIGMLLTWQKNARHHSEWYGNYYHKNSFLEATLAETPVETGKTYKSIAFINEVISGDTIIPSSGKLILYFKKDSNARLLTYGEKILIKEKLQEISNSGNPGAFDYKRYCAFHQIFHRAFLDKDDWISLKDRQVSFINNLIFSTRQRALTVIDHYVKGSEESAIAKALIVGYKSDLDKDLVQAYSDAGVVHLMAISGLHMALIYGLLFFITSKSPFIKKSKPIRFTLIILSLWFFALLTGASASVLRAAVMFTFIATAVMLEKTTSIYNSLAGSAFALLCFDPFLLWDVGFQLSYSAVIGIITTQKYIFNWVYIPNKVLRWLWRLTSVSIAAQLFTFPLSMYYFNQMPLLFPVANLIAIPLATVILWSCIILIIISPIALLGIYVGKLITGCIWLLNQTVLFIDSLPFSVLKNISLTATETWLLSISVTAIIYWLIKRSPRAVITGLISILLLSGMLTIQYWKHLEQRKLIVYDVPSMQAIDFINGASHFFIGDPELKKDGILKNFHLKPSRIFFGANRICKIDKEFFQKNKFIQFDNKRIFIADTLFKFNPPQKKIVIDYIVLSKNPGIYISDLAKVFNCSLYIFDAANPLWKIEKWKKDCEDLHLHFYSVPERGTFMTDL